jgi:hypothetical protein
VRRLGSEQQPWPSRARGTQPGFSEADDRIRTYDLLITNQLLYRLSYVGMKTEQYHDGSECHRIRQGVAQGSRGAVSGR